MKVYVAEYHELANVHTQARGNYLAMVPQEPPLRTQVIDLTGTQGETETFNDRTNLVTVRADVDCHYRFSRDGGVGPDDPKLPADEELLRGARSGLKLAVMLCVD